jgi:hypothetical protein
MTLNKDGKFVKWWLWWGCFSDHTYNVHYNPEYWRYEGTNICQLGRTAFIWAPLKSLIVAGAAGIAGFLLYMLGWAIWFETLKVAVVAGLVVGIIALVVGFVWGIPRAFNAVVNSTPVTVFADYVAAKNGKYCTKVEIV